MNLTQVLETRPFNGYIIKAADAFVRWPNGNTGWVTLYQSTIDYYQWLWSVKDRLSDEEIAALDAIIDQMKSDAVDEAEIAD